MTNRLVDYIMFTLVSVFFMGFNLDKELLKQKSIYELRIIGRELGVKAPTKLKKQVLIHCILERIEGKTQPFISNRGRRPLIINVNELNLQNSKAELIKRLDNVLENTRNELLQILDILL